MCSAYPSLFLQLSKLHLPIANHSLGFRLNLLHEPIHFVLNILRVADEAVVPLIVLDRFLGRQFLIFLPAASLPLFILSPTSLSNVVLSPPALGSDAVAFTLKIGTQCGDGGISLLLQLVQTSIMLGGREAVDRAMNRLQGGVHLLHELGDVHLGGGFGLAHG